LREACFEEKAAHREFSESGGAEEQMYIVNITVWKEKGKSLLLWPI